MSSSQANINLNAILWLKTELDKTLADARSSLDFYIDNPSDMKSGKEALALYKLAYGVLKMARIRGGEILLQELIAVMNDLLAGRVRRREDALDTIMQATIQLPDYLDYLQAGNADVPIVLLPLLNDMRATRDAELLSDSILELEELNHDAEFYAARKSSDESVQQLAKALRGVFQKSLLEWYQNRDALNNLLKLAAIFFRLGNASKNVNSRRLWLVSQSVVEAIQCGDLESSIAVKSLLGKVDRQMKRLIAEGEEQFDNSIPIELVKNLLFYVAAANSGNKTVNAVKEVYKLNQLLPDGGSIETARANLRGSNPDIYDSLIKAVVDDINGIKERLEVYAFADKPDADILRPVVTKLSDLAETNSMLGLADERERLQQASQRLEAALQAESILSREELQDIASVLVDVEIAVKGFAGDGAIDTAGHVPEQEYRKVYHAVIQETLTELGKVRATTLDYLERYKNYDLLKPVPPLLKNIRGAMQVLPLKAVEPLLVKLEGYVSSLIHKQEAPSDQQLAAFADGLSSIEFYLESLEPGIGDQQDILEKGKASLAQLDDFIVEESEMPIPVAPEADVLSAPEKTALKNPTPGMTNAELDMVEMLEMDAMQLEASDTDLGNTKDVAPANLEDEQSQSITPTSTFEEQAPAMELQEFDQGTPIEVPTGSMELTADAFVDLQVLPDSVDQEILEIFLEEAEEERERITENLASWSADNSNMDAVAVMRRSFHTLKGSGRLVGAEVMGEFAWSLETLLNRVMDKSVSPTVEVIATLEAARDELPDLIKQIQTRNRPNANLSTIKAHAEILAKGGSLDAQANKHGDVPEDITVIIDPAEEQQQDTSPVPEVFDSTIQVYVDEFDKTGEMSDPRAAALTMTGMDQFPTLSADDTNEIDTSLSNQAKGENPDTVNLQVVVLTEVEEQLDFINGQLKKAKEFDTRLTLDTELMSATQTLNNVARTADIPQIYSVFAHVEHYLDFCASNQRDVNEEFPALLQDVSVHIETVLQNLRLAQKAEFIDPAVTESLEKMLQQDRQLQLQEREEAAELEQVTTENDESAIDIDVLEIADPGLTVESVADDLPELEISEQHAEGETPDIINAKDAELIGIFLEEAREILDTSESLTTNWADEPDDSILIKEIQRHLHTLKGGARMAGLDNIGNLSHGVESLFDGIVEGKLSGTQEVIYLVRTSFDTLGMMVNSAEKGKPVFPASGLIQDIEAQLQPEQVEFAASDSPQVQTTPNVGVPSFFVQETQVTDPYAGPIETQAQEQSPVISQELSETAADEPEVDHVEETEDELQFTAEIPAPVELAATATQQSSTISNREDIPTRQDSIKVNPVLLDELVNQAGEINIFHSRIDDQIKQTSGQLEELQQTIARLSAQLRNLENEAEAQILSTFKRDEQVDEEVGEDEEFDPLELDRYSTIQQLSRSLAESINDLTSLEEMVSGNLTDIETLLLQKSRISTDLQEGLMRTRLVPFSIQLPRLQRIIRQTATELGKEVELVISGEQSELDRKLLESMVAPLEHLLRNAVAHGIETPDQRMQVGKPAKGTIEISIKRSGPEIELLVSDDGAGINIDSVREKAISSNLLKPDSDLEDEEVLQFILESGFSTSSSVDQISGRGVGLDVVNHEIKKLNGGLRIQSEPGKGTTFHVNLPFTLAINQSLLIQSGDDLFAVPVSSIYGVIRMQPEKIARQLALDEPVIDYGGTVYALRHLGSMLNRKLINMNTTEDQLPLLLVNTGDHRVAFLADSVLGSREIVVKPLGPPLNNLVEYSGATILGDGNVALILDMPGVVRTTASGKANLFSTDASEQERKVVMVVDDSITIRKVTARVLERNNYHVLTAKDGMDALQQLNDQVPDIMLLDVEMPRMDGFELAAKIRQSEELKQLPIIMITSRTGKKHQERAAQIGVNRYLGKPFQEEVLLQEIVSLLEQE